MKTELKELTNDNLKQCFELKVDKDQMKYIASNEDSYKDAKENADVARPFAIYHEGKMVGFAMFAFDELYEDPLDRYWLWRFMIDRDHQGKGIGSEALKTIIGYFKDNGANNIRLSTKEDNTKALNLYRKAGFYDTGEMNDEEIVLQLDL
ncbi:MAG: GNAT family N-acetyltransferase [Lachnospiraceae bacterium]|nr:GNAT family N-acetyltransferase [Lachnospiraceae bacterium]